MSISLYGYAFSYFKKYNLYVFLRFEKKPINLLRGIFIGQKVYDIKRSKMEFIARPMTNESSDSDWKQNTILYVDVRICLSRFI